MKTTTLTPRHDEICINGNIRISVGRVENGRVRLAIDAPKDVQVHREEVCSADHGREERECAGIALALEPTASAETAEDHET